MTPELHQWRSALLVAASALASLVLVGAGVAGLRRTAADAAPSPGLSVEVAAAIAELDRGDFLNYTDPAYLSGLDYPPDFSLSRLDLDNGDSQAVFRKGSVAVQLTMGPDSEGRSLSVENIRAANPGMKMSDVHEIVIGDATPALAFDAEEGGNKTFEVWFTQNDLLYQASTHPKAEALLLRMLQTFAVNWPNTAL